MAYGPRTLRYQFSKFVHTVCFTSLHVQLVFVGFRCFSFPWFIWIILLIVTFILFSSKIISFNFILITLLKLSFLWITLTLNFKINIIFTLFGLRVVIWISLTILNCLYIRNIFCRYISLNIFGVILEKIWVWNIHLIKIFNTVIERPY